MSPAAIVFLACLGAGSAVLAVFVVRMVRGIRSFLRTVSDAASRIEAAAAMLPESGPAPYTQAVSRAKDPS